jgi:hypothetical protein
MSALPANLDVDRARLPAVYEAAKRALAECSRIDQCKQWADKAEALASYARQAADQELRRFADRIQARAIRRCGQLLKEYPPHKGGRPSSKTQDGTVPSFTRTQAAEDAGLSERQRKTAVRVANVPEEEFEAAISGDTPATVTDLAVRGTNSKASVDHLDGRDPVDFENATRLIGTMSRFNRDAAAIDLTAAARGLWPNEAGELCSHVEVARDWLAQVGMTVKGVGDVRAPAAV